MEQGHLMFQLSLSEEIIKPSIILDNYFLEDGQQKEYII
jgi:hypothetical protein